MDIKNVTDQKQNKSAGGNVDFEVKKSTPLAYTMPCSKRIIEHLDADRGARAAVPRVVPVDHTRSCITP